jgi:hypothetical protein
MRRGRNLVALAAAGLMLLQGQASAAPTLAISGVTVTGGTGSVTGTAEFAPITAPQSVTTDLAPVGGNAAALALWDNAGLDLRGATIEPVAGGLKFTWLLNSMPPQVPPEGVRYTWGIRIGTRTYQLQAKRTNLVGFTTAEAPVDHIQQAAAQKNFFQLRGNCVPAYPVANSPVAGCYHLAFLDGSFDIANKQVTMTLPFEAKDSIGRVVAPDFKAGAVLTNTDAADAGTATMTIAAGFQALVSNTTSNRYINGIAPYYTAPQVSLAVAAANIEDMSGLTFNTLATISNGSFSGNVSGLTATKNTVYARACYGVDCTYSSFKAL